LSFQPSLPRRVLSSPLDSMRIPVQFNNHSRLCAEEVNNVRADRMLTPKLQTSQTVCSQKRPEFLFSVSLITPQALRVVE
jgi:hypothetical protein